MKKKDCLISHEEQKLEFCLFCKKKINLSYMEKLREKVSQVPIETKQQILDLLKEGKTIGQVKEIVALESGVLGEIILNNIVSNQFLRDKAI